MYERMKNVQFQIRERDRDKKEKKEIEKQWEIKRESIVYMINSLRSVDRCMSCSARVIANHTLTTVPT